MVNRNISLMFSLAVCTIKRIIIDICVCKYLYFFLAHCLFTTPPNIERLNTIHLWRELWASIQHEQWLIMICGHNISTKCLLSLLFGAFHLSIHFYSTRLMITDTVCANTVSHTQSHHLLYREEKSQDTSLSWLRERETQTCLNKVYILRKALICGF